MVFKSPSTEHYEITMLDFLKLHPKLEKVHFDNVLFPTLGSNDRKAMLTMSDIITYLHERGNVELIWYITLFKHHPHCKRKMPNLDDDFSRCRWRTNCGVYDSSESGSRSRLDDFQDLAERLGVQLVGGRFWDFGSSWLGRSLLD